MLDIKLDEYAKTGAYPFHMPGHKRVRLKEFDPYAIDITEIPGFDDLHEAAGVIDELQRGYADIYGADKAYVSVNGSTLGNLSAIFAATKRGDEIIVGAGCHRSIPHAAELNGLTIHWIEPEPVREILDESKKQESIPESGHTSPKIIGQVTPDQVKQAIDDHPEAKLVVITSPGYDGIVSDVDGIVKVAHDRGVMVHIDGAHGAHHGFGGLWEKPIIASGADSVVLSLHKTLPAFTGSSVLLTSKGSRLSGELIDHYNDCFETSSPSYILMYGMAVCLRFLQNEGKEAFKEYSKNLTSFYEETKDLKNIRVCRFENQDISKIIISGGMSGEKIAETLRNEYSIETERTGEDYCLALSSVMDTKEAFEKLAQALFDMNGKLK